MAIETENRIKTLLIELGISSNDSIIPYYPKVRDRDDISILKCTKSGVILLSRSDHMDISHYSEREDFEYWDSPDRKTALRIGREDTQRRFEQFKNIISSKKWIDVGTGVGGILDLLSPLASETVAVEPQKFVRNSLIDLGYKVYPSIEEVPGDGFDVVTLFHVLEHFTDPINTLKSIRKKMVKKGKIIIEVPHANDFLISFLDNEAFKSFTFWSEHLILHTRESLSVFLKTTGFSNIVIKNFQRYPLANHLYWLTKDKPGGHIYWDHLRTAELDRSYSDMLAKIDKTDTLIAMAEN